MLRVRLASARRARERGAAAVEFALVSTLLVTLLLGIIAFGFALYRQQSALHAAREGARLAAVGVDDCDDFEAEVARRGTGANIVADDVAMAYEDTDGSGAPSAGDSVTVTVPFKVDLSIVGFLGFSTFDGAQRGTARVEQLGTAASC